MMGRWTTYALVGVYVCILMTESKLAAESEWEEENKPGIILQSETGCYVTGAMTMTIHISLFNKHANTLSRVYNDVIRLPDHHKVSRNCSMDRSEIRVKSDTGNLELVLIFEVRTNSSEDSWALTELQLKARDPVTDQPVQLSKRGRLRGEGGMMFEAPYNRSYQCQSKQRVVINSPKAHAALVFSQVRLQPFVDIQRLKSQKGVVCPQDLHPAQSPLPKSEVFVPLILAISLSVVALLLIMGYLVHRRVGSMGYINMD